MYGHDKGDEFSVILRNEDYQNRETLIRQFEATAASINSSTDIQWKQVHISMGFADYDTQNDVDVNDVMRRADKMMYDNKRLRKKRTE